MLELGRPTHVFDLAKIHGALSVRWARDGETLKLLNGDTVTLAKDVGVIADEQAIESLAGIMGGDATAVSLDTTDIYLEAAFWWPDAIRGRARRYGFSTDAAHRFERGVDPATTVAHIERITRLIVDICGTGATRVGPIDDQIVNLPKRRRCACASRARPRSSACRSAADEMATIFTASASRSRARAGGIGDLRRHAAAVSLRHRDRGGPDRGGRARLRLREDPGAPAGRAGMACGRSPKRVAASTRSPMRWPRATIARRSTTASSRPAGSATSPATTDPIRLLNPIAAPLAVMRSSLIGSLVANVALQREPQGDARADVRDREGLPPRSVDRRRAAVGRRHRAAAARRRHRLGRCGERAVGRRRSARSTSST